MMAKRCRAKSLTKRKATKRAKQNRVRTFSSLADMGRQVERRVK